MCVPARDVPLEHLFAGGAVVVKVPSVHRMSLSTAIASKLQHRSLVWQCIVTYMRIMYSTVGGEASSESISVRLVLSLKSMPAVDGHLRRSMPQKSRRPADSR